MESILRGYGLILGADRKASGAFLLALTLLDPRLGMTGLGAAVAIGRTPNAACNAALTGMLFAWAGWPIPALLLALLIQSKLPVHTMAWRFLLTGYPAWFLFGPPQPGAPLEDQLLSPLGAILFRPDLASATVCVLAIALTSRYYALLFLLGGLTASLVSHRPEAIFNGALTASVLGGIFSTPSPANALRALLQAAVAALLATLLTPTFVLPFHLVALASKKHFQLELPEQRFARYARQWHQTVQWTLPFWGEWVVCQAPDGGWTHVGPWNEAWDFIVLDPGGRSHKGRGLLLSDYYCYDLPVAAPADGTVVALVNDVPDNEPGRPNHAQNWGNLVVLAHGNGLFTEISHFRQGTLAVELGQQVRRGQLLGRCGNSGLSCEPHLHIQLQAQPWPGAPSLPTRFQDYLHEKQAVPNGRPANGQRIQRRSA